MGGLSVAAAEELGRQRRAELDAARTAAGRREPGRSRRLQGLRRGAGRALVVAGLRLAGADGAGRTTPVSI